jgi:hypothetical protein
MRYPRLDTILMVEKFIKEHDGEFKKRKLWESLPKKMMYQTFSLTINYLLESRKISIDSENKIGWIYYPKLTNQLDKFPGRKNETSIKCKVRKSTTKRKILRIRKK